MLASLMEGTFNEKTSRRESIMERLRKIKDWKLSLVELWRTLLLRNKGKYIHNFLWIGLEKHQLS